MTRRGLLLIGHGTRKSLGIAEFEQFVAGVRHHLDSLQAGEIGVDHGYLELHPNDIRAAVGRFAEQGVSDLLAFPLLLFSAGHHKQDIPAVLAEAERAYALSRPIRLAGAIGHDEVFIAAVARRVVAAGWGAPTLAPMDDRLQQTTPEISKRPKTKSAAAAVLLVGRGSSDVTAYHVLEQIARTLATVLGTQTGQPRGEFIVQPCSFVGVGPSLQEGLDACVAQGAEAIYVVPYLWFSGWLTDQLHQCMGDWKVVHPEIPVSLGQHLGVDESLTRRVAERAQEQFYIHSPLHRRIGPYAVGGCN